jgi:hypothetical protein
MGWAPVVGRSCLSVNPVLENDTPVPDEQRMIESRMSTLVSLESHPLIGQRGNVDWSVPVGRDTCSAPVQVTVLGLATLATSAASNRSLCWQAYFAPWGRQSSTYFGPIFQRCCPHQSVICRKWTTQELRSRCHFHCCTLRELTPTITNFLKHFLEMRASQKIQTGTRGVRP